MEEHISTAAKIGAVLLALAVVIGLGFSVFSVSKDTANTGVENLTLTLDEYKSFDQVTYNQKDVSGAQIISLLQSGNNRDYSVLIHTSKMTTDAVINPNEDRSIVFYNDQPYVNYCRLIADNLNANEDDLQWLPRNSTIMETKDLMMDNTVNYDNGRAVALGSWCVDSSSETIMGDYSFSRTQREDAVEYIDTDHEFESLLLTDPTGVVLGVILTEIGE